MFDEATFKKLKAEVPGWKIISTSRVSETLKVNGSLARRGIRLLEDEKLIRRVGGVGAQLIYTRIIPAGEEGDAE